jgi:hypothetical protein
VDLQVDTNVSEEHTRDDKKILRILLPFEAGISDVLGCGGKGRLID